MSRLFKKTLVVMIVLFGAIATATSAVSGWNLYTQATRDYESKGAAIARSIAGSSAELLHRDVATIQSLIDEFATIDGVAYIFVADESGDVVSHTFVPGIPEPVLRAQRDIQREGLRDDLITITWLEAGASLDAVDIAAPILAGAAGYAHVGMDRRLLRARARSAILGQQGAVFAVFLATIGVSWVLVNRISQPLNLLARHARTLAAKDFTSEPHVSGEVVALSERSHDEIGHLASSFIHMERALQQYIVNLRDTTAAKERIESELKVAHDIQMAMVPKTFALFRERQDCDLFAALVPAKEVGGDFYDFGFLDEAHLFMAIGDVAGKGVPAALFMAMTTTLLRSLQRHLQDPGQMLTRLNDELCRDNAMAMFVTLFVAVLDVLTGRLQFSNGGHNLPYVMSHGGIRTLANPTNGLALGAFDDVTYQTSEVILHAGDGLLLYTDGVTEAMDSSQHLLSEERLMEFLRTAGENAPDLLTQRLIDEVHRFAGGAEQSDDITVLALRYLGR